VLSAPTAKHVALLQRFWSASTAPFFELGYSERREVERHCSPTRGTPNFPRGPRREHLSCASAQVYTPPKGIRISNVSASTARPPQPCHSAVPLNRQHADALDLIDAIYSSAPNNGTIKFGRPAQITPHFGIGRPQHSLNHPQNINIFVRIDPEPRSPPLHPRKISAFAIRQSRHRGSKTTAHSITISQFPRGIV